MTSNEQDTISINDYIFKPYITHNQIQNNVFDFS